MPGVTSVGRRYLIQFCAHIEINRLVHSTFTLILGLHCAAHDVVIIIFSSLGKTGRHLNTEKSEFLYFITNIILLPNSINVLSAAESKHAHWDKCTLIIGPKKGLVFVKCSSSKGSESTFGFRHRSDCTEEWPALGQSSNPQRQSQSLLPCTHLREWCLPFVSLILILYPSTVLAITYSL